jgi:hypothetical protein
VKATPIGSLASKTVSEDQNLITGHGDITGLLFVNFHGTG